VSFDSPLDPAAVRVIGALIEKEITTPDNYPLTLNALVSACNQTSNREPVMTLTDDDVMHSIEDLRKRSLVRAVQRADSRTTRYRHLMSEGMGLDAGEIALMCVLMLRGPQTAGELNTRTARLHQFASIESIERALELLTLRNPPIVVRLPRRPGQKEVRFAHLLSGEPSTEMSEIVTQGEPAPSRIAALEQTVESLRAELGDLRATFEEFRRQFQ
jgi:uncharacterized protein YceH (UPF0502 family)